MIIEESVKNGPDSRLWYPVLSRKSGRGGRILPRVFVEVRVNFKVESITNCVFRVTRERRGCRELKDHREPSIL